MGYERQLSKEDIRSQYAAFTYRFSQEPFDQVHADVEEQVKRFYHDSNFLLQMSILMLNHHMLSEHSASILNAADEWLEHGRKLSDDIWITKQINYLQASIALIKANPETALNLLEAVNQPKMGDEVLLATAYEQLDNQTQAKRVIQVMMYQNIIEVVGSSPNYLQLVSSDLPIFNETIDRIEGLIELYSLRWLHPNTCLQFYYSVAQRAASQGNSDLMYTYLEKFVDGCIHDLFPLALRSDDYFYLLQEWLEDLDLGTNVPRDASIIKQSIHDSINTPFFDTYADEDRMTKLKERLASGMEI
ncbi:helix-turn-helix transcriptional regulator [Barrientosiimonas marina]|uniref:Uncharacterized protein n=1 Tax=Lentibacillus kimchii TaxID=1542911 RepID=A0ABW2UXB3_9BACI